MLGGTNTLLDCMHMAKMRIDMITALYHRASESGWEVDIL